MKKPYLLLLLLITGLSVFGNDTLYFRLSNPWNTVKDPNGQYLRKCVKEKDYYHVWDYNAMNRLVTESYYADTNFSKKLFCHKYFNEDEGWLEQTRCYSEGRLDGYFVNYDNKGEVLVEFTINIQGRVENVKVIKSRDPLLDQEAVRVIQRSPRWKPAMQNGKKVPVYMNQTIIF